ncbi:MAG: glycosyltransferase [Planctomycetales bacterium]|nr:glycosyltransferase [Planctomycetales bacterium]
MLIIDALNTGGGSDVLLKYLCEILESKRKKYLVLTPKKVLNSDKEVALGRYPPFSLKRNKILLDTSRKYSASTVLCFGNVPPAARLSCRVVTYFHNALILSSPPIRLDFFSIIRFHILRQLIWKFSPNCDQFICQTRWVATELRKILPRDFGGDIILAPFFQDEFTIKQDNRFESFDFIYVSSEASHKNHKNLFDAVQICTKNFPLARLAVTFNSESSFRKQTKSSIRDSVINLGKLSRDSTINLTKHARFVIFPSVVESLGLGLVEACLLNKIVLTSDLPFSGEVIKASATFDPLSPQSIANCMSKALRGEITNKAELQISNEIDKLVEVLTE